MADAHVTEFAPAKINLALHVVGRRADGHHLLETLVVFARYGDRVEARIASEDHFGLDGPFADGLAADDPSTNLVLRARDTFRAATGWDRPVALCLHKRLPLASGIGGGSSDGAATLRALSRLSGRAPDPLAFMRLAATLGADVPMCLAGTPLLASGVGEHIAQLEHFPALHVVLATPPAPVSTPAVFRALERRANPPLPGLPDGLAAGDMAGWLASTRNDLQATAIGLQPSIASACDALRDAGAAIARMSGSGATCFGIFSSAAAAGVAAAEIKAAHPDWFVVATETGGTGMTGVEHEPHR